MNLSQHIKSTILNFKKHHWLNVLIVFSLAAASGFLSMPLSSEYLITDGFKQASFDARLVLLAAYITTGVLLIINWHKLREKLSGVLWWWLGVAAFMLVTVLLGQLSASTLTRLLGFYGATMLGIMLYVCTKNSKQLTQLVFATCAIIVICNVFYIDWSVLVNIDSVNVRGMFFQKNQLGHYAFLTMLTGAFMFLVAELNYIQKGSLVVIMLFSAWLLFLSTSMTSNLLIPIAIAAVLINLLIQRYKHGLAIALILAALALAFLFACWDELFALIGKSTTFTGRTFIWQEYWALILQHPILGHGYGAFVQSPTHWTILGPHSGYIEILYTSGAVGALLILAIILMTLKNWWQLSQSADYVFDSFFIVAFLAAYLSLNFTENYFLSRSGLYWPLFVYVTLQANYLAKITQKTSY